MLENNYMRKTIPKIILLFFILLITSCSAGTPPATTESDTSQITAQSTSITGSITTTFEENPATSNVTQSSKAVDFSSKQNALKDYINFARSETKNKVFEYGYECIISLQNIFGDEKPEIYTDGEFIYAVKEDEVESISQQ